MSDDAPNALIALVPPLLQALEALHFASRHLDPMLFEEVIRAIEPHDAALRAAEPVWPAEIVLLGETLDAARADVLRAFDELRAAQSSGDLRLAFRALRGIGRANEALYPLAAGLSPVSRHFLPPEHRGDAQAVARAMGTPTRDDVGVFHIENERGMRGGFSLYVPEYYAPETPSPLVLALHGGSGNGRDFLWAWLAAARALGAIVVAPTAIGPTWAIGGDDVDTPNLMRILAGVQANWRVDPTRMLLTGMSDGGTFSYVSGLEAGSPFTHLAPVAASFHPMLAAAADAERIDGLPIYLVHGARDWMFPIDIARTANEALSAAGARVTYREIEDLSHTYPREINGDILAWLNA
jgi:phospholipase/carboxylesterase